MCWLCPNGVYNLHFWWTALCWISAWISQAPSWIWFNLRNEGFGWWHWKKEMLHFPHRFRSFFWLQKTLNMQNCVFSGHTLICTRLLIPTISAPNHYSGNVKQAKAEIQQPLCSTLLNFFMILLINRWLTCVITLLEPLLGTINHHRMVHSNYFYCKLLMFVLTKWPDWNSTDHPIVSPFNKPMVIYGTVEDGSYFLL